MRDCPPIFQKLIKWKATLHSTLIAYYKLLDKLIIGILVRYLSWEVSSTLYNNKGVNHSSNWTNGEPLPLIKHLLIITSCGSPKALYLRDALNVQWLVDKINEKDPCYFAVFDLNGCNIFMLW